MENHSEMRRGSEQQAASGWCHQDANCSKTPAELILNWLAAAEKLKESKSGAERRVASSAA